jgi:hypothetical protein
MVTPTLLTCVFFPFAKTWTWAWDDLVAFLPNSLRFVAGLLVEVTMALRPILWTIRGFLFLTESLIALVIPLNQTKIVEYYICVSL